MLTLSYLTMKLPLLLLWSSASSFLMSPSPSRVTGWSSPKERLYSSLDGSFEDLDRARAAVEELFFQEHPHPSTHVHPDEEYLLLTSAGRKRRELEMELLSSLKDSDDAMEQLMHLWTHERDPESARQLTAMQENCSSGLVVEQQQLGWMIETYPSWAEPYVRLATLLFYQGRIQESYDVALQALKLKPWHFECYSLLTMLSLRQRDTGQALQWARQGLLLFKEDGKNRRRQEWVDRALQQAAQQWKDAEKAMLARQRQTEHFALDTSLQELENARAEFEKIFFQEFKEKSANDDDDDDKPDDKYQVLTSVGRHLRELEMDLLSSLKDSDDSMEQLMHLWTHERDPESARQLTAMQESCSSGLVVEQQNLSQMIETYPSWAEPYVRLATLLFYKGQTQESYDMTLKALEVKPWHFECFSLLVMLSLRQGDKGKALQWARQGLLLYKEGGKNRRRQEWIDKALQQAAEQLEDAEKTKERETQQEYEGGVFQ